VPKDSVERSIMVVVISRVVLAGSSLVDNSEMEVAFSGNMVDKIVDSATKVVSSTLVLFSKTEPVVRISLTGADSVERASVVSMTEADVVSAVPADSVSSELP